MSPSPPLHQSRVMVFGTFDGLHPGHRFVLDTARQRGTLIVVVGRDATVQQIKGVLPEHTAEERRRAIAAAYPDATVILGDAVDFLKPLREERPDLIVLGYDQGFPPGVEERDLSCPIERLPAYHPKRYKSSKLRR